MRRTDVVVPAGLVAGLRVPARAVTTGEPAAEWVAVPVSRWRFVRRPGLVLPLDSGSARLARRYLRTAPWFLLVAAVAAALVVMAVLSRSHPVWLSISVLLAFHGVTGWLGGAVPEQSPRRTAAGGLRIPAVPVEVAQQWVADNPGVVLTDEPEPWRRSRSFYAAAAIGLVAVGVGLGVLLAKDRREDPFLLSFTVLVLVVGGLSMAFRILPRGYVRFEAPD